MFAENELASVILGQVLTAVAAFWVALFAYLIHREQLKHDTTLINLKLDNDRLRKAADEASQSRHAEDQPE